MFAAVAGVVGRKRFAIEGSGSLWFAAEWLNEIAGCGGENDAFAVGRAVLGADASEEIGHLVILIVGPLFHGMVVALGAIDRHSEKSLGSRFGKISGIVVDGEEVGCAVGDGAALRGDNVAGHDVPGRVGGDIVMDPIIKGPH